MTDQCKNGHPRTEANTYHYPEREGRKPRITCRVCRDGLPNVGVSRVQSDPQTIYEEFEIRKVRPWLQDGKVYDVLSRYDLLGEWLGAASDGVDMDEVTLEFFSSMCRVKPYFANAAFRLLHDLNAKVTWIGAEGQ